MNRALIIRSGAVGDCIVTGPVLESLRYRYANLSIDVIGTLSHLSPLHFSGLADQIHSIDRPGFSRLFIPAPDIPSETIHFFNAYDLIVSYLPDPDGIFSDNLNTLGSARIITGVPHPAPEDRNYITRHLITSLEPLGISPSVPLPDMTVPVPDNNGNITDILTEISQHTRPTIAIHPGSGGLHKCWPHRSFAELIAQLHRKNIRTVLTFGAADGVVRGEIHPLIDPAKTTVIQDMSLHELAYVLTACDGYIGNDSGITHLAAAVGTPTIALFGPTDPAIWGPRGKCVRILWGDCVIEDDVAVQKPAQLPPGKERLETITVDRVIELTDRIIRSR